MSDEDNDPLDIKELLGKYAEGAGKETAKQLLKKIKELINKKRYGFTTSDLLANSLENIGKRDVFQRLKECVGNHRAQNLIRVGIHISELNEEGQRKTVEKLRSEVFASRGARGLNIINMGSTRAIVGVIEYLSTLKMQKNLKKEETAVELDEIIREWTRITIFVKRDSSIEEISSKILDHIKRKVPLFFVFGYGAIARGIATKSVAKLNNENQIYENDYLFFASNVPDNTGCYVFSCIFQLC